MDNEVNILPHLKLQLAIQHPNVEDCWSEGYECSQEESLDESSNPYKDGSIENEQWREGWWAGFYGEEPLFEVSVAPQEAPELQVSKAPKRSESFGRRVFLLGLALFSVLMIVELAEFAV